MNNILRLQERGGYLFPLLCLICIMAHSSGMLTLFCLFCIFFMLKMPPLDRTAIVLLFFSGSYIIFAFLQGAITTLPGILTYGLPWVIFYMYGKYIFYHASSEKSIIDFILIITLLSSLTILITILMKIVSTGQIVDPNREFLFMEREDQATTGNGICLDIFLAFAGIASLSMLHQFKVERILFLIVFILALFVPVNLITRAPIVAIALCIIGTTLLGSSVSRKKTIFIIMACLAVLVFFYSSSGPLNDVFQAFADRNEDGNISTMSDRTYRWTDAVSRLFATPFGWYNDKDSYVWVHNMWLDIAKYSGIIPFVLLLIPSIRSVKNSVRIVKSLHSPLSYILMNANICFLALCFVQPLYGSLTAALGCMIWGIQSAWVEQGCHSIN